MIDVALIVEVLLRLNHKLFHGVTVKDKSLFSHINDIIERILRVSVFVTILQYLFRIALNINDPP
jgi:hypothetical protein